MTKYLLILILTLPSISIAECKIKIIEYPDHNEAVCEQDNGIFTPEKNIQQKEPTLDKTREITMDKVSNILSLSEEQKILISNKALPEIVAAKLAAAEKLLAEIDLICTGLGNPELLNSKGEYMAAAYAEMCINKTYFVAPYIASMNVSAAKCYADKGNKAVAKKMYRDVIVRFTGSKYISQIKQAEFGLEDLK